MPDILHDFPINAPVARVFDAVSTPAGLDQWWTKHSAGVAAAGATWELFFGPEYDWRATVTRCAAPTEFELELVVAMDDWIGTRVGFTLEPHGEATQVRFRHLAWAEAGEHYRISAFCWAMYLRILKRYLERGEAVAYEARLDA